METLPVLHCVNDAGIEASAAAYGGVPLVRFDCSGNLAARYAEDRVLESIAVDGDSVVCGAGYDDAYGYALCRYTLQD